MARYQDLPNRTDTIVVPIDDQSMCYNYSAFTNCLTGSMTKNQVSVTAVSGACTWTVPAGVTSIYIEVWGAGGGGGGHGNCCCCSAGIGGGAGAYLSATISTAPGCQYILCAGSGGSMGCASCTNGGTGGTSYVTGYNLSSFCAIGGTGATSGGCNACTAQCCGSNFCNAAFACITGSTIVGNALMACGEGGHLFGRPQGCRHESRGGSAPFAGGMGAWTSYNSCCPCQFNAGAQGGEFPGGGGAGAFAACCCGSCNCGGCGAGGLVRIWY